MNPYRLTTPILILLLFSCKNPTPAPTNRDTAKIVAKDTVSEANDSTKDVENGRLETKDWIFILGSEFGVWKGKVDWEKEHYESTGYYIFINKKTGHADTLEAEGGDFGVGGCQGCIAMRDMTDSFQLNTPVLQLAEDGEGDYTGNWFIGYQNGKLKRLFSFDDRETGGTILHRSGSKLIANTAGRDEVVEDFENDYPLEVDTKTFQVTTTFPVKQYIGWETNATESFRAHRVINGITDSSLVAIKVGTELKVDTLYRTLGKVRLRLADSVLVEVKMETAKKKLKHNNAG